jgi:hypothetical protein
MTPWQWFKSTLDLQHPVGWLALWGAVLATLNTVVQLVSRWRDTGRLVVRATVETLPVLEGVISPLPRGEPRIWLTITNIGSKPVNVAMAGARFRRERKPTINVLDEPRRIEPHEQVRLDVGSASILDESLAWLGARDTLERTFKVRRRNIRNLRRRRDTSN